MPRICRKARWPRRRGVRAVKSGHTGTYADAPGRTNRKLYGDDNPLAAQPFESKVKLLETMDAYARAKDPRCGKSPPASPPPGKSWRFYAPMAKPIATFVRWCG